MLKPQLVTPPADTVLNAETVKDHLLEDQADQDGLIDGLLAAATSRMDGYSGILGRCLVTQTWKQSTHTWPIGRCFYLPLAPVASISSVKYFDTDDVEQTLAAASYSLLEDSFAPYVRFGDDVILPGLKSRDDAVTYEFVCGYGDPEAVPQPIKQAMNLLIGTWYRNRESVVIGTMSSSLPDAVDALIEPYRRVGF